MKKFKVVLAALLVLALPVFVWAGVVRAQEFKATVDEGEIVDSTLYAAGRNVDINGTINGDVFCAGQNVQINATVIGDIICAGQTVVIKGEVDGDIRVAGQAVTLDAQVSRSITVAAQSFSFDASSTVGGDATLAGGSLNIKGEVGRDVVASGADIVMSGTVGRNAEVNSSDIDVRAAADIAGTLTYTSEDEAAIATGAKIAGGVIHQVPQDKSRALWGIGTAAYLYFLAAFLLIGLVLALFFPQAVRQASQAARKHFGKTLLIGFVGGFAIPVVAFLLGVTFIGLPLAIMVLMLWAVLIALTAPIAGYFLADLIFKKLKNIVVLMLIGTAILLTLCFLPFVGIAVALLAYWIGSGAMLLALKRHVPKPNYKG